MDSSREESFASPNVFRPKHSKRSNLLVESDTSLTFGPSELKKLMYENSTLDSSPVNVQTAKAGMH